MAKQPAPPAAAEAPKAEPPKGKVYYALRTIEAALVKGGRKTFRFGDKIEGVIRARPGSVVTPEKIDLPPVAESR